MRPHVDAGGLTRLPSTVDRQGINIAIANHEYMRNLISNSCMGTNCLARTEPHAHVKYNMAKLYVFGKL